MKYFFILYFILVDQILSVDNPFEIGNNYPKSIAYDSKSYAFGSDKLVVSSYSDQLRNDNTLVVSSSHQTEVGAVIIYPGSGNAFAIKTQKITLNQFKFVSLSPLGTSYSVLDTVHSFRTNSNICLFNLMVSSLNKAYAAWIDTSSKINLISFSSTSGVAEGSPVLISRTVDSNSIDCKGFSDYAQFICVYKSNIDTETGCILDVYNNALSSISNHNLRQYGCDSTSIAQKILDLNQRTFFVCYTKNNGYVDCLIATQSTGSVSGNESGKNFLQGCDIDSDYTKFEVGKIGVYYFVLCTGVSFMKYRRFTSTLSTYGEQIDLSSSHQPLSPNSVYLNQFITLIL